MNSPQSPAPSAIEGYIRFGLILILAVSCYHIVLPFVVPVLWGLILAVALYPLHGWMCGKLSGRRNTAALIIALALLVFLLVPSFMLAMSTVDAVADPIQQIKAGTFVLPVLPEKVANLPFVGSKIAAFWQHASSNLPAVLSEHQSQVLALLGAIGASAGGAALMVLQFAFSIIIAGIFMAQAPILLRGTELLAESLFARGGASYVQLAGKTIQSVAQGVIGVAVIQSVLVAIGLVVFGVPAAGIWAVVVLIFAVAQLPVLLVVLPLIGWMYSVETTTTATLFTIWMLVSAFSETVLKPMMLGRGVSVPMIVILIGAIGGMLSMGMLGLFVGAVTLAVAYELVEGWVKQKMAQSDAAGADEVK